MTQTQITVLAGLLKTDVCQRIVHPSHIDEDGVFPSSGAFKLGRHDRGKLSTYLQSKLTADDALNAHRSRGLEGDSVWGVSVAEAESQGLTVLDDGGSKTNPAPVYPYGHASIDMNGAKGKALVRLARNLKELAIERGRLDTP